MGNCLLHESSMTWGGEDWGSPDCEMTEKGISEIEEKGLLRHGDHHGKSHVTASNFCTNTSNNTNVKYHGTNDNSSNNNNSAITEVKIKVTKKELEELLGKMNVNDMSVQQVLAQLIDVSDSYQTHQLRSWRPALQSIPEVN